MKRILFLFGTWSGVALASPLYNYQNIPIGERSFGMGMVSMAIEGDASATFTNPAVLTLTEHSQVSASLSAYARTDTRTGEYVSIFESATDNVKRAGVKPIPSMFGGHLKSGSWTWGGAALIPDAYDNSGIVKLGPREVSSFESTDQSIWLGLFASRHLDAKNAVGLSLFYVSRSSSERFFFTDSQSSQTNPRLRYLEQGFDVSGIVAVLGGTYEVSPRLRIGYGLRLPPLKLGGKVTMIDAASDGSASDVPEYDTEFMPLPARASVGFAWSPSETWTFAADLHAYGPVRGSLDDGSNEVFRIRAKEIANLSMGAEYIVLPWLGLRAGWFTNISSAERVPKGLTSMNDRVHMFGGTAALAFIQKEGTLSVGGYLQGGQGRISELAEYPVKDVPRTNYLYGFVVGSSYRF